jgi:hypothetical protein
MVSSSTRARHQPRKQTQGNKALPPNSPTVAAPSDIDRRKAGGDHGGRVHRQPEHLFGSGQAAEEELLARMADLRSAAEEAERTAAKEITHARALRRLAEERAGLVPPDASAPLGRTA